MPAREGLPAAVRDGTSSPTVQYPDAPWRLRGEALFRVQGMSSRRTMAPPALATVAHWPRRTPGGLYLARYDDRSSLAYNELIVFSAIVRLGVRIGAWVRDIYVDDPRSAAGGRRIWGLPKQMATFRWLSGDAGLDVTVSTKNALLCRFTFAPEGRAVPVPLLAPAWSRRDSALLWFRASGSGRARRGRGTLHIPPSSPIAGRGLRGGRTLHLGELDVEVPDGRVFSNDTSHGQ